MPFQDAPFDPGAPRCSWFVMCTLHIIVVLPVQNHRSMSRVRSLSSPWVVLLLLCISMAWPCVSLPYWDKIALLGSFFMLQNPNPVSLFTLTHFSQFSDQSISVQHLAEDLILVGLTRRDESCCATSTFGQAMHRHAERILTSYFLPVGYSVVTAGSLR